MSKAQGRWSWCTMQEELELQVGWGAGNESRMESHFIPWLDLKSTWKVKISCKFKLFQNA